MLADSTPPGTADAGATFYPPAPASSMGAMLWTHPTRAKPPPGEPAGT